MGIGNLNEITPRLVDLIETEGADSVSDRSDLKVVEIPDDATDWELKEFDGMEQIIAVVNGKLVHIN